MKKLKLIFIGALLALPMSAQAVGISDAEMSATTCFMCHGPEGKYVGGAIPALAGYPADYMAKTLKDFKSGKRPSTVMQQHMKGYSEREINELAAYLATLKP